MTPELSSFLGVSAAAALPRHEIEARILQYVKDHNLVDEINKIVMYTDETLEDLMDGKKIFSGFSIIPNLKHHLDTVYDSDTISTSSQEDQLNTAFIEEENEPPSDESNEESNEEQVEQTNEENSEESSEDERTIGVMLRDPSGNQLIFERCRDGHICIQNQFVVSQDEFRQISNTLCPAPPAGPHELAMADKEEQPYEMIYFLIMFMISILTMSLYISIMNDSLRKMS